MKDIFNITKLKPLIKFNGYKYIGAHETFEGINYYLRAYDNHNNFEFMEAKIEGTEGLFRKYMLASGTSIKILDSFMYSYLKHRKDEDIKKLLKKGFIEKSLEENNFEDIKKLEKVYSNKVPSSIAKTDTYQKMVKDGYDVLYVMSNESPDKNYSTVYITLVKEEKQELVGTDLSYVVFKNIEFAVKPSYVKGDSKDKYMMFELPGLNIPVSILK